MKYKVTIVYKTPEHLLEEISFEADAITAAGGDCIYVNMPPEAIEALKECKPRNPHFRTGFGSEAIVLFPDSSEYPVYVGHPSHYIHMVTMKAL